MDVKVQQYAETTMRPTPEVARLLQEKRETDRRRLDQIRMELIRILEGYRITHKTHIRRICPADMLTQREPADGVIRISLPGSRPGWRYSPTFDIGPANRSAHV